MEQGMKRHERSGFQGERRRPDSGSQKRGHFPALQVGNEFDVEIKELGHKGDGMIKLEGFTVFIKNVEKGEKVKVRIIKVMENIAMAERLN